MCVWQIKKFRNGKAALGRLPVLDLTPQFPEGLPTSHKSKSRTGATSYFPENGKENLEIESRHNLNSVSEVSNECLSLFCGQGSLSQYCLAKIL